MGLSGDGRELAWPLLTFHGSLLTESSSARGSPPDRGRAGSPPQFREVVRGPPPGWGEEAA